MKTQQPLNTLPGREAPPRLEDTGHANLHLPDCELREGGLPHWSLRCGGAGNVGRAGRNVTTTASSEETPRST